MALSLAPLDRWTLGYLGFAAAMLFAPWRPRPAGALAIFAGYAALAALALAAPRLRRRGGMPGFLADVYPLVAAVGLYTAIGMVNAAAGVSQDAAVQRWEQALFGGQPSLEWIRAAPWPWPRTRAARSGSTRHWPSPAATAAPPSAWHSALRCC